MCRIRERVEVRFIKGEQSHKIWDSGREVERGVGTRAEEPYQGNLFHSGRDMEYGGRGSIIPFFFFLSCMNLTHLAALKTKKICRAFDMKCLVCAVHTILKHNHTLNQLYILRHGSLSLQIQSLYKHT